MSRDDDGRLEADFLDFREHGQAAALARVFDASVVELLQVARHLAPDRPTAEDLVQETFLVAIEKQAQFDAQRRLMPWLIGILANRARQPRPRQSPRQRNGERAEPLDPCATAQSKEFIAKVQQAIEQLPPPYRAVLDLHLTHGLSARDIARTLGRNRGTVRSQLSRGMDILRRGLPPAFAVLLACGVLSGGPLAAMRRRTAAAAYRSLATGRLRDRVLRLVPAAKVALLIAALGGSAWGIAEVIDSTAVPTTPPSASTTVSRGATPLVRRSLDPVRRRVAPTAPSTPSAPDLVVRAIFADRKPAGGAMVLSTGGSPDGLLRARWRRADRHGRVEYRDLRPGNYRVTVARGGASRVKLTAGRATSVDVVIPRGVSVVGRVVDRSGIPLPQVPVQVAVAAHVRDLATVVACSDARGEFALRDVAPGRSLSALPPDAVASWTSIVAGPVGRQVTMTLQCGGAPRTIEGTVRSHTGVPLSGARVVAGAYGSPVGTGYGELPAISGWTDASGHFRCSGLPLGRVPIWIGAPGHAAWRDVLAPGNQGGTLEVRLRAGATLRGVVREAGGDPVAGALVGPRFVDLDPLLVRGPSWAYVAARTDARGNYTVEHIPPGRVQWTARAGDRTTLAAPLSVGGRMELRWDPEFDAAVACQAQIVDPGGRPLAGWALEIGAPATRSPAVRTTSDAAGRFSMAAIRGIDYELWGLDPASALQRPELLARRVRFGRSSRIEVSTVPATCRLSARIVAADGHAVAGAMVTLLRRNGPLLDPVGYYRAGADGAVAIEPVPPGSYGLAFGVPATGTRVGEAIVLRAGERRSLGDLALARPARLEFRARGSQAAALQFAKVDRGDGAHATARLHGGVGELMVQPGRLDVSLWGGSAAINHAEVVAVAGEHIVVEIPVDAGRPAVVEFAPTDRSPALLEFEWIDGAGRVRHRASSRWPPEGARAGETVVRDLHLIPGRYVVRVTDDLGRVRRSRVEFDGTHAVSVGLPGGAR